jgi:hypothetical protein
MPQRHDNNLLRFFTNLLLFSHAEHTTWNESETCGLFSFDTKTSMRFHITFLVRMNIEVKVSNIHDLTIHFDTLATEMLGWRKETRYQITRHANNKNLFELNCYVWWHWVSFLHVYYYYNMYNLIWDICWAELCQLLQFAWTKDE